MAQTPVDGMDGGSGLTGSTVNFSSISSVDYRSPQLAYQIVGCYAKAARDGSGARTFPAIASAPKPTVAVISTVTYKFEAIHHGYATVASSRRNCMRLTIRNEATDAMTYDVLIPYASLDNAFNLSSIANCAVLYP